MRKPRRAPTCSTRTGGCPADWRSPRPRRACSPSTAPTRRCSDARVSHEPSPARSSSAPRWSPRSPASWPGGSRPAPGASSIPPTSSRCRWTAANHPWTTGGGGAVVIARLTPQKRVDLAIETVAFLASCGHELPLTIVGDGPERGALERLVERARRPRRSCTSPARCASVEVPGYLAHADLMIFPAQGEGFGLVAAEALMAGVPVVACWDGGGVLDVVPPSRGGAPHPARTRGDGRRDPRPPRRARPADMAPRWWASRGGPGSTPITSRRSARDGIARLWVGDRRLRAAAVAPRVRDRRVCRPLARCGTGTSFAAQPLEWSVQPGWILLSAVVVWLMYALLIAAWRRMLTGWGQRLDSGPPPASGPSPASGSTSRARCGPWRAWR